MFLSPMKRKHEVLVAVKLTKNADPGKYYYFRYDIGFDVLGKFSLSNHDDLVKM